MKKNIILLALAIAINACTSFKTVDQKTPFEDIEKEINAKYSVLSTEYFKMLEDPFSNSDIEKVQKKFETYKAELVNLRSKRKGLDKREVGVLNSYINKVNLNLQYLKDLSD